MDVGELIEFQFWVFSCRVQEKDLFSIRELYVHSVCISVLYIVKVLKGLRTN